MAMRFYLWGLLLVVVTLVSGVLAEEFKWLDVTPTTNLIFHDCFNNHQCARLDVPMDYNRTDGKGSRVALAIIKIPAKVPVTDPRYGGAILLNPGGPGGSGVSLIFRYGASIQTIADTPSNPDSTSEYEKDSKYFDILSFDPRGVNNTTPQVICFPNLESRESWMRSMRSEGTVSSSEIAFATKWARYLAVTESCVQRMNLVAQDDEGEDNLLEHVNTAPVVGDMVSIIEALGEWREGEALRILDSEREASGERLKAEPSLMAPWRFWQSRTQNVLKTTTFDAKREEIIERTKWKKGEEKLLYWGFSYGTVLGATFAAMQPQRVGRVILDGVVDSEDYYTAEFKMNLNDAEDVFTKFFHYCSLAGPTKCPFSSSESETAISLRQKFDTLLSTLKDNPIPVYTTTNTPFTGPDIVTSSNLLIYTRSTLYSPLKSWPILAQILHDLQNKNGTSLSTIIHNQGSSQENGEGSTCATKCEEAYSAECQGPKLGEDPEMSSSVWCADGLPVDGVGVEDFKNSTLRVLRGQSELFGDIWAELRMQCVGWRVRPKWRYGGFFRDVVTSHPVLWIGTSGDHVCPMINAHKMEASFPGSVALEQTSQGHCSLSGPSLCTASHVRKYFQTGELPPPGTICGVDQLPFETQAEIDVSRLDSADKDLWEAIKDFDGF